MQLSERMNWEFLIGAKKDENGRDLSEMQRILDLICGREPRSQTHSLIITLRTICFAINHRNYFRAPMLWACFG